MYIFFVNAAAQFTQNETCALLYLVLDHITQYLKTDIVLSNEIVFTYLERYPNVYGCLYCYEFLVLVLAFCAEINL